MGRLVVCIILFLFSSCQSGLDKNIDPNFVFCLFNKDEGPTTFMLVESLDHDEGASLQIPLASSRIREREYIQKNGVFYRLSNRSNVFSKYKLEGSALVLVDSLLLNNPNFETVSWKDEDNLLAVSREEIAEKMGQARIYQINVKEMKIVKQQTIILPYATPEYWALHVGLVDYDKEDMWLAYSFFKDKGKYGHTTLDTTYYATIDYNTFEVKHVQKEVRSTYPGGFNIIQSYSFKDEHGDYYFMAQPGIALGNNTQKPTAIFRKKNGQNLVDQDYMINISELIGNHAYGIWYAGNGKAVIRNEQKESYTDFSNYHSVYQFEYRLVDLIAGTIEKIPFPLDKGTQKENIWSDTKYIYAAIDAAEDEHRVWKYNMQTKEVSKGIKLPNTTNYTVRLDYLK